MKKFICILLILFLAVSASGCSCLSFIHDASNLINSFRDKTPAPSNPAENTETAAPAAAPESSKPSESRETNLPTQADKDFEETDREMFLSIVTSDGLTYHQYVIDPAFFDIDEADVERGWGDFSYEAAKEDYAENRNLLARLDAIDSSELSEMNKLAYDNIYECLTLSNELENYYYYDEPLTTLNGAHTTIPLMLTLYEIYSEADIENYLYLLEDSARYFKQIEQFEREKAEQGLFMTENALDQVIASCREFIKQGDNCFLTEHFEKVLNEAEFELSEEKKEAYLQRNRDIVSEKLIPAYIDLINVLEQLRADCGDFTGAAAKGEEAKAYFCAGLKNAAAFDAEYTKIAEILKESCDKTFSKMNKLVLSSMTEMNRYENKVTTGSVESDIEYLKSLMPTVYPEIPEQVLTYVTVPDAIAEDFSPAAYLISAFDDSSRNVVLLNPSSDNSDMLFTLAHECFPGHLYQIQYFRNMKGLSFTQQLIAPTGYLEGWAVFSENFAPGMFKEFGTGICRIKQLESALGNILIPGYVSLQVNTCGWTKDDIKDYLGGFGLDNDGYVDIIYEYAVNMPLYFFNYAMGYTLTNMIYEHEKPGNNTEKLKFFTRYLNYGPCYYDILFEKFGIDY